MISCSKAGDAPVVPSSQPSMTPETEPLAAFEPSSASDVIYSYASRGTTAYKAFGIYEVTIDTKSMTAEIIPTRKAQAIGNTFDSDLTQFLIVSPCANCLQINGIKYLWSNQMQIGFAIKHPFADIIKRPDLHGFDVRGIVISKGNYNFPLMKVQTGETSLDPARANVSLIANPDGYTHHFDGLAADPNYFDPPRNYDANINPFRRYFEDAATDAFDPHNPSGHNVLATGCDWETQNFIFNIPASTGILDFVFVCDVAYGQSATFQNRQNPYYFLPEFNRKEAWKVGTVIKNNDLQSGVISSTLDLEISVFDWQAGLDADPNYPDTLNLDGISAKSDVSSVAAYIPSVSGIVQTTSPVSGDGSPLLPYVYDLTLTNSSGAVCFTYYGIVAVRDDLQGQQGPIGIPESPSGFPFPGPDIYDYSVYQIFPVRVNGAPPQIDSYSDPDDVYEGTVVDFLVDVSEPDGDTVEYYWEQISPVSPIGRFIDDRVKDVSWEAPQLTDVPLQGLDFTLRLTAIDPDGQDSVDITFQVLDRNSPPMCDRIDIDPYWGVAQLNQDCTFTINATDPEGDTMTYEWDFNYFWFSFDVEDIGQSVQNKWMDGGLYTVACRISEDRPYPHQTICTTQILIEGSLLDTFQIDDSANPDERYVLCDVQYFGNQYHVIYLDLDTNSIYYCRSLAEYRSVFTSHQMIFDGSTYDSIKDVRLMGYDQTMHVVFMAHQPMHLNTDVMIVSSIDGGASWDAYGGARVISSAVPNTYYDRLAACHGPTPDMYFLMVEMHMGDPALLYGILPAASIDNGESWDDVILVNITATNTTGPYDNPTILASANGIIHAFWYDNMPTPRYYYDYSTDFGDTWQTDILISDSDVSVSADLGTMAVQDSVTAHFVWPDLTNKLYYRQYQNYIIPVLTDIINIRSNISNMNGLDIYVSPNGKSVMIPFSFWSSNPVFMHSVLIYNSINSGTSFDLSDIAWNLDTGMWGVQCAGRYLQNPNRNEILTPWTQGGDPEGHIYGDYYYLAERF
jgi:hypothetical protein